LRVCCPQCGKEILYITTPGIDGEINMVDVKEQRLISKNGRILIGYPEHICTQKPAHERIMRK
jgi:hypothetical protein